MPKVWLSPSEDKKQIPPVGVKRFCMSDIYHITLTTQTGEIFTGKMSRLQPEIVNGFMVLVTDGGGIALHTTG